MAVLACLDLAWPGLSRGGTASPVRSCQALSA